MTRKHLASTAALIAVMAGTVPAIAQTPGVELPSMLQGLDLDRISFETKRDGQREYEGYLPDGTQIEAEFDMAGNLIKVEADDGSLPAPLIDAALPGAVRGTPAMALFARFEEIKQTPRHLEVKGWQENGAEVEVKFAPDNTLIGIETDDTALPQPIIDAILPQAVRGNEVMAQFGMIEEIKAEYGRFEVKGEDTGGQDMRAAFDEAGAVLRFGRDDDRRGGRDHDRGPRGHGSRGDGPHGDGPRGDGPRAEGPRGDGPRAEGPRGDGPRGDMPPAPQFDTVAANQRLTQAGYSAFGLMRQEGPRVLLDATNPDGETVTLELDPQGQLVRETAR
ncbi:hypothetical protein [Paracoccus sp. (in: a-proteobacteria)]|uniref:hypothetical protein n=1 Tax=Paracoccus sp. TaxID=267 RepID=UPI002729D028|nr:hypothetical protein [Paracoccus sp. (in: a-proteobacteria)]